MEIKIADKAESVSYPSPPDLLTLDTAIAQLEDGVAEDDICVDLGDGILARADGNEGQKGLLQRLRAYKFLLTMAIGKTSDGVVAMQLRKPELHPDVASILDALHDDS